MSGRQYLGDAPGQVLRAALTSFVGISQRSGDRSSFASAGWDRYLDWCRATLDATTAFAVDHAGLVIAQRGEFGADVCEELAARLGLAMAHASQIARGSNELGLVVRYRGRWLTMLRLDGEPVFKIVLAGDNPIHPGLMQPDSLVTEDWDTLLRWTVAPDPAEVAFLVDRGGLIVAAHGQVDDTIAQAVGARLGLLFEQVDRVQFLGKSAWLALRADDCWWMSVQLRASRGNFLLFAARSRDPIHPVRLMDLKRTLRDKLRLNPNAV
ncbi:MAG: hypothetical protein KC620_21880 [Myxococcales bacterium]|nr:hypothetical protein [Myxococcales bacterium]